MRTETYREAVEAYLEGCFADQKCPQQELLQAMRYSLLAGGKRIRPILLLEFCRICGGEWRNALPFAAAIEMVHTYSLIHDDLPCMDNDDYRRGRLTNHKVFGEANAVLAGDALLTAAFETAANAPADAWTIVRIIRILSEAAGANGMVGGQVLDLAGEKIRLEADAIHTIHALKTGALISAACQLGVIAAAAAVMQLPAMKALFSMVSVPMATFGVVALLCLFNVVIMRTRLGQQLRAVGQSGVVANAAGIDVDHVRIIAIVFSTILAGWGQLIFVQNMGSFQTYGAHEQVGLYAGAAILVGGASVIRATNTQALVGCVLFHLMFILAPAAGKNLFGDAAIGEYFRVFICYGVIALALVMHAWSENSRRKQAASALRAGGKA